ncbi:hypothetical protein CRUP_008850, partial [Coryphaenoides rupestris]
AQSVELHHPIAEDLSLGTSVQARVSGELHCGNPSHAHPFFQMPLDAVQQEYLREAVEKIGIPKILSVLEPELTGLLDKQGANLFDIVNPEVISQNGFVVIQMDFGFPHHLLVDFLRKTLQ